MKLKHKRSAGLDVHKREVVACLRLVTRGKASHEVRRFPTTTRGLIEMADWLEAGRLSARRHGGNGRLLEAGLAHPRGPLPTDPGQRRTHQGRAGQEE